jgi:tRNA(Ile)-lysidine synthase
MTVPLFKALNLKFIASFQKNTVFLAESQQMVEDASIMVYQESKARRR